MVVSQIRYRIDLACSFICSLVAKKFSQKRGNGAFIYHRLLRERPEQLIPLLYSPSGAHPERSRSFPDAEQVKILRHRKKICACVAGGYRARGREESFPPSALIVAPLVGRPLPVRPMVMPTVRR